MDTITILGTMLASFVVCQLLFHFVSSWFSAKVFPQFNDLSLGKKIDWNLRVVSACHGSVVGILCLYIILKNSLRADLTWGDSPLIAVTVAIIAGYITSELLLYVFFWRLVGETVLVIQFCIGLYGCCLVLFYMEGALSYLASVHLLRPLAAAFLNQLYFFDILEYPKFSEAYIISVVFTTVMMFVARIAVIPCFYYFVYCIHGTDDYMRLGSLVQLSWISCSVVIHITDVIRIIKIIMIPVNRVQSCHQRRESSRKSF